MPSKPSLPTIKRLFAVSGNRCAFPGCDATLVNSESGVVTGRVCHIRAARPDGPRFDPKQTDDKRHAFDNLLLLCSEHHDFIDKDQLSYPPDYLSALKQDHEKQQKEFSLSESSIAAFLRDYMDTGVTFSLSLAENSGTSAQKAKTINLRAAPPQNWLSWLMLEAENIFSATRQLMLNPFTCFDQNEIGTLRCAGLSGLRYWFYILLIEIGLSLLTTSFAPHFSHWFFVVQVLGSTARIILLLAIWASVGALFGFGDRMKEVLGVCLFSVAVLSLFACLAMVVPMAELGLHESMVQWKTLGPDAPKLDPRFKGFILVGVGFAASSFFYVPVYLSSAAKVKPVIGFIFYLVVSTIYGALRPHTVIPLYDAVLVQLIEAPWAK